MDLSTPSSCHKVAKYGDVDEQGEIVDALADRLRRKVEAARVARPFVDEATFGRLVDDAIAACDEFVQVFRPVLPPWALR